MVTLLKGRRSAGHTRLTVTGEKKLRASYCAAVNGVGVQQGNSRAGCGHIRKGAAALTQEMVVRHGVGIEAAFRCARNGIDETGGHHVFEVSVHGCKADVRQAFANALMDERGAGVIMDVF